MTCPAAKPADLDVTYDSAELELGTYQGLLHITTNDPDEATIDIPVTLQVVSPTDAEAQSLPASFSLAMLSANPARNAARFMLAIPQRENVDVRVYNVRGEVVRELSREIAEPGYHVIGWDGRSDTGQAGGLRCLLRPHARRRLCQDAARYHDALTSASRIVRYRRPGDR